MAAAAPDSGVAIDPEAPGPGRSPEGTCVHAQRDQVAAALQIGPAGVGGARVSEVRTSSR